MLRAPRTRPRPATGCRGTQGVVDHRTARRVRRRPPSSRALPALRRHTVHENRSREVAGAQRPAPLHRRQPSRSRRGAQSRPRRAQPCEPDLPWSQHVGHRGGRGNAVPHRRCNPITTRTTGAVVRDSGYTVLQYWFFYAYNDWRSRVFGVNDHEADWEQVTIYLAGPARRPAPGLARVVGTRRGRRRPATAMGRPRSDHRG